MLKRLHNQKGTISPLLIILLIVIGIVAYLLLVQNPPLKSQVAQVVSKLPVTQSSTKPVAKGKVSLTLKPSMAQVNLGQEFTVDVVVDTMGLTISGAELHVNYDPALLQGISITKGSFLPNTLGGNGTIKNGKTEISVACDPENPKAGTGTLATLKFKALKASASPVTLSIDPSTIVAAITYDKNVLHDFTQTSIIINSK